jgi:hypothetical protein
MNRRFVAIELVGEVREDGSVYISSPDVQLFHAIAPSHSEFLTTALPILKEHLERNLGVSVTLYPSDKESQSKLVAPDASSMLPPHVIAELAA